MELKNKSLNSTVTLGDLIGMRYHQSWFWPYEYTRNNQTVKMTTKLYEQTFEAASTGMKTGNANINSAISDGISNMMITFSTWLDVGTSIAEREYIHASVSIPWETIDTQQYVKSEQYAINGEIVECGNTDGYITFIPRAFINALINESGQIDGSFFGIDVNHIVQNVNTTYFMFKIDVRLFL